ncbi:MAG TPA: polyketide antibiotic transporter [Mycobacterium sp.]
MSNALRPAEARPGSGVGAGLVWHAWRMLRRGAVVVLLVAAGMSAVVVWQYRSLAADGFDPGSMRALAESPAIRIMFGKPVALGDPGGFTVWRTGTPMVVLMAVWSALTAVRITRGEEEAGRWNLLLAGRVRLARLLGLQLAVVMAAAVAIGLAVAAAMIVAGTTMPGAVLYGTALALIGAGAAAWGGLAGQLVGDRRRASVLATAGIGAGMFTRMVADSADWASGLHWLTPFGLLGLIEPFAGNRPGPLAVLLLADLALAAAVAVSSSRRDVGAGVLPAVTSHRARLGGLRSLPGFAVRRSTGSVVAWATGIWLYFLVIGLLASSLTVFLNDNPLFADLAARAGFGSLTTVAGYLASLFALLAVPLGLFAASRVAAGDADEEARRLTLVFAAPVTRRRWFLAEAGITIGGTVVLSTGAGLAAWAGVTAVGADIAPASALGGALNVLPIAWLSLAAALLAYGWLPQSTLLVGAVPAVGGFVLQVLAESLRSPAWILSLSPYQHMNAVPYESVNWAGTVGMILIAVALATIGLLGFHRRDLRG